LGTPGLAALLLPQTFPISSVVAPCHPGAALRDSCHDPRGDTGSRRQKSGGCGNLSSAPPQWRASLCNSGGVHLVTGDRM